MIEGGSEHADMHRIVERLSQWRRRHSGATDGREAREELKAYVCANEKTIRQALDLVEAMGYERMVALLGQHSELNTPEGVDIGYARQLVDALCDPSGTEWILTDVDDYVNVLNRAVEYAEYG